MKAPNKLLIKISVSESEIKFDFTFFQVLADQAVWAVCGRVAGVIDMGSTKKQTMVVEVMPLVGGHLALPRVRLSKYIPATVTGPTGNTPATTPAIDVPAPQPFGTRGKTSFSS